MSKSKISLQDLAYYFDEQKQNNMESIYRNHEYSSIKTLYLDLLKLPSERLEKIIDPLNTLVEQAKKADKSADRRQKLKDQDEKAEQASKLYEMLQPISVTGTQSIKAIEN